MPCLLLLILSPLILPYLRLPLVVNSLPVTRSSCHAVLPRLNPALILDPFTCFTFAYAPFAVSACPSLFICRPGKTVPLFFMWIIGTLLDHLIYVSFPPLLCHGFFSAFDSDSPSQSTLRRPLLLGGPYCLSNKQFKRSYLSHCILGSTHAYYS